MEIFVSGWVAKRAGGVRSAALWRVPREVERGAGTATTPWRREGCVIIC